MAKIKVFEKYVKLQGQGHLVKNFVPMQRSCYKVCTNEIWNPYLFWLGSYGKG